MTRKEDICTFLLKITLLLYLKTIPSLPHIVGFFVWCFVLFGGGDSFLLKCISSQDENWSSSPENWKGVELQEGTGVAGPDSGLRLDLQRTESPASSLALFPSFPPGPPSPHLATGASLQRENPGQGRVPMAHFWVGTKKTTSPA